MTDDSLLPPKSAPGAEQAPARIWLERALAADERAERAEAQVADLKMRLRGALGADPATATQALSWMGRAANAEALLGEVLKFVKQRSLHTEQFPAGWVSRAAAQMKAAEIVNRDIAPMFERNPPAASDYWTRFADELGREGVVRDHD